MRKLTKKEIAALKPGDEVASSGGQVVKFVAENKATYSFKVQFSDRNHESTILALYEAPKK